MAIENESVKAGRIGLLLPVLLFGVLVSPAYAQDWRISPVLSVGGEYDDNARLSIRTDDLVELEGLLVEGSANVIYLSQTSEFQTTPLIRDRSYPNDPEFDATEIEVPLRYTYAGTKNNWRIDARYSKLPVRNAERADDDLDVDDPDNIPDDDSSLVGLRGDRDRFVIRPRWTYLWSDVSSSSIQLEYRDVSYDEAFIFLRDYTDATVSANYRRNFSERFSAFITGLFRHYETDPFDVLEVPNEYDTVGANIGFETQLTPQFRMRAYAGAENVESKTTGISETIPVGELTFIRRLKTIRLLAQYRRSVSSTGSGNMSERDAVNLNFTRDLSERFEAGLGVRAYRNQAVNLTEGGGGTFARDYLQLNARFTWNITRTFSLQTSYRYTLLSREIDGESANSNQVVVWLMFRPTGLRDER
jgi:hypothetical protein